MTTGDTCVFPKCDEVAECDVELGNVLLRLCTPHAEETEQAFQMPPRRRGPEPYQDNDVLAALRELLESQPWSTGLDAYSFDREEAAWARARELLEASHAR